MPTIGSGPALVLRFDVESAAALVKPSQRGDTDWPAWLDESLRGVAAIRRVLDDLGAPASFFLVGELLERAGTRYAELLAGRPGFDIGNHTFSHLGVWNPGDPGNLDRVRAELAATSALIERWFGETPLGFTTPGGYYRGLQGKPELLRVLYAAGFRYLTSDAQPGPGAPRRGPAPLTQPYWYADEGFPDLLEVPITGWHCNMLFNSGRQNDAWQPAPGFPDGGILERLPVSIDEGVAVRRRELEFAVANGCVYAPCMHPWSVVRFDPDLEHLRRLIQLARDAAVPVVNCRDVYAGWPRRHGRP